MGSASRTILLSINMLASLIALAVVGIALYVMLSPSAEIPQLAGMPIGIYYSIIVFGSFVFFVSFLGIAGTCLHSKILTILFIFLDLIIALALLITAILILVYANGTTNVKEIDTNVLTFQDMIKSLLDEQATKQPEIWNVTQTTIGCCGIDLESTYHNYTELNISSLNDYLNLLQPGPSCDKGRVEILSIHNKYSTYSSDAEKEADSNNNLKNYFCKDIITSFIVTNTIIVGAIAAILVIIQITTAASGIILLTKVTTINGGFIPPPQENGNSLAYGGSSNAKGKPQVHSTTVGNTLA